MMDKLDLILEKLDGMEKQMEAQEKRLSDMMAQQRKEIMQDVKTLLDTDVQTRFNLLMVLAVLLLPLSKVVPLHQMQQC